MFSHADATIAVGVTDRFIRLFGFLLLLAAGVVSNEEWRLLRELTSRHTLGQDVRRVHGRVDVLESDCAVLHFLADEMVLHVNMLASAVEFVLRFDTSGYDALVILVQHDVVRWDVEPEAHLTKPDAF